MMQLVGDVGGTHARLALARDGVLQPGTLRRVRGENHASFDELLAGYLAGLGRPAIAAVCIAVAGPVEGGQARLTNRDWSLSTERLRALTGAAEARLMNDLIALGHATATLPRRLLRPAAEGAAGGNGQSLVVNAGTGFNVCASRATPSGLVCLEAEEGHTDLPAGIAAGLAQQLGPRMVPFASVEEVFSGPGFARFHALRAGLADGIPGGEALAAAAAAGDPAAVASFAAFARLFGALLRELALRFRPREGIWLAGSLARALVPWAAGIEAGMLARPLMRHLTEAVPLLLIEDDTAGLQGCLNAITR